MPPLVAAGTGAVASVDPAGPSCRRCCWRRRRRPAPRPSPMPTSPARPRGAGTNGGPAGPQRARRCSGSPAPSAGSDLVELSIVNAHGASPFGRGQPGDRRGSLFVLIPVPGVGRAERITDQSQPSWCDSPIMPRGAAAPTVPHPFSHSAVGSFTTGRSCQAPIFRKTYATNMAAWTISSKFALSCGVWLSPPCSGTNTSNAAASEFRCCAS